MKLILKIINGLSPFNILNPADIETIEVLKDADATAKGSRDTQRPRWIQKCDQEL